MAIHVEGPKGDINNILDGQSSFTVEISSTAYTGMVSKKQEVLSLFNEIVTIHKQIEKDIKWDGKGKEKYNDVKVFIDKFMNDFPELFEVLGTEINNISSILDELFGEVSNVVKEFNNYD